MHINSRMQKGKHDKPKIRSSADAIINSKSAEAPWESDKNLQDRLLHAAMTNSKSLELKEASQTL